MQVNVLSLVFLISTAIAAGCNGNVKLCDRLYSEITQVGAHDSPFVGALLSDNQGLSVQGQLNAGIRFLTGQAHNWMGLGTLYMCHSSCWLLNVGTLVTFLKTVNTWMVANPNEVVTLLLTNGDSVSVTKFGSAMVASGLSNFAYTPSGTLKLAQWPTLQEMIDSGKRLVTFLGYGADTSKVPYILDEFTYFWETMYDTTDATFNDCSINRPPGGSATGRMSIINHFLDDSIGGLLIPANENDAVTNSPASIEKQAALCKTIYGTTPNVILVDRVGTGDVFTAQNDLNGL